ncbi:MAG: hypothetical protein KDJ47_05985 [Hyphomicrobiaceae bacterium]|nr:hypothetical protein [Hyphomicrobiaceae bacterium]
MILRSQSSRFQFGYVTAIAAAMALCVLAQPKALTAAQAVPFASSLPPVTNWQVVSHERLGFELSYPASVFQPAPGVASDAGRVFVSRDGMAKLLIAAIDNEIGTTLEDYRQHVLTTSYQGATVDYAPVRRSWFVLSGVRDDTEFYERVSFTCGGRRITSWAMLYPRAQSRYYSRILESIAPTFRPSRSVEGSC